MQTKAQGLHFTAATTIYPMVHAFVEAALQAPLQMGTPLVHPSSEAFTPVQSLPPCLYCSTTGNLQTLAPPIPHPGAELTTVYTVAQAPETKPTSSLTTG